MLGTKEELEVIARYQNEVEDRFIAILHEIMVKGVYDPKIHQEQILEILKLMIPLTNTYFYLINKNIDLNIDEDEYIRSWNIQLDKINKVDIPAIIETYGNDKFNMGSNATFRILKYCFGCWERAFNITYIDEYRLPNTQLIPRDRESLKKLSNEFVNLVNESLTGLLPLIIWEDRTSVIDKYSKLSDIQNLLKANVIIDIKTVLKGNK